MTPQFGQQFILDADASDFGIGTALPPVQEDQEIIIAYANLVLTKIGTVHCDKANVGLSVLSQAFPSASVWKAIVHWRVPINTEFQPTWRSQLLAGYDLKVQLWNTAILMPCLQFPEVNNKLGVMFL